MIADIVGNMLFFITYYLGTKETTRCRAVSRSQHKEMVVLTCNSHLRHGCKHNLFTYLSISGN